MNVGSRELTKAITAYLACVVFVLAFLVATVSGGSGLTAVTRGAIAAAVTYALGGLLMRPLLSTVLDAMARDRVEQEKPGGTE